MRHTTVKTTFGILILLGPLATAASGEMTAQLQRFAQRDPLTTSLVDLRAYPDGLNVYRRSRGSPQWGVDPSGLCQPCDPGCCAEAGAAPVPGGGFVPLGRAVCDGITRCYCVFRDNIMDEFGSEAGPLVADCVEMKEMERCQNCVCTPTPDCDYRCIDTRPPCEAQLTPIGCIANMAQLCQTSLCLDMLGKYLRRAALPYCYHCEPGAARDLCFETFCYAWGALRAQPGGAGIPQHPLCQGP